MSTPTNLLLSASAVLLDAADAIDALYATGKALYAPGKALRTIPATERWNLFDHAYFGATYRINNDVQTAELLLCQYFDLPMITGRWHHESIERFCAMRDKRGFDAVRSPWFMACPLGEARAISVGRQGYELLDPSYTQSILSLLFGIGTVHDSPGYNGVTMRHACDAYGFRLHFTKPQIGTGEGCRRYGCYLDDLAPTAAAYRAAAVKLARLAAEDRCEAWQEKLDL